MEVVAPPGERLVPVRLKDQVNMLSTEGVGLTDFSYVVVLALRYKSVNFGSGKSTDIYTYRWIDRKTERERESARERERNRDRDRDRPR